MNCKRAKKDVVKKNCVQACTKHELCQYVMCVSIQNFTFRTCWFSLLYETQKFVKTNFYFLFTNFYFLLMN